MTTPSEPDHGESNEGVNLGKSDPTGEAPFDPYRFGKPDHPIPAEYAPPGYTGPVTPSTPPTPYPTPGQWGSAQYGGEPANPFSNPPGVPYGPPPQNYQYPPGAFGPTPPPPYQAYGPQKTGNGKAVAALVFGILSILFCWLFFFDAVFVILGLVFSIIVISETKGPQPRSGRGLAIAGLVCTIVGALVATVLTVLLVQAARDCGGFNSNRSDFETCLRDNFG